MDSKEFEKVFADMIEHADTTLLAKAREYADDSDRLHNFKVAAGFTQGTPEQALWGFLTKHLVSISDMIKSGDTYSEAMWDEKIGDSINYLILLRALVKELRPLVKESTT